MAVATPSGSDWPQPQARSKVPQNADSGSRAKVLLARPSMTIPLLVELFSNSFDNADKCQSAYHAPRHRLWRPPEDGPPALRLSSVTKV